MALRVMTRAESIALSLLAPFIVTMVVAYTADALGFGVVPILAGVLGVCAAVVVLYATRHATPARTDVALLLTTIAATSVYLVWRGQPSLLPQGSGPDLTHHLLLIDYIEQQGTLVHDQSGGAALGEMADYTPGVHILSVVSAALLGTHGFFTIYPVVIASVALKFGCVSLLLLALLRNAPSSTPLTIVGTAAVFSYPTYTFGSFLHDSFLAQVVAEFFAVATLLALVSWSRRPSPVPMVVFAASGVAAFLTWPVWIGPSLLALGLLLAVDRAVPLKTRAVHAAIAIAPIAMVAAVHAYGRTASVGLVGTSGAVPQPSLASIGWGLPALAIAGAAVAVKDRGAHAVLSFAVAIAMQAAALVVVAQRSGAATPYMAIKMTYLAIYPAIALAVVAVARIVRLQALAWLITVVGVGLVARQVVSFNAPPAVVSSDLWAAGVWARDHLPPHCVDYLVGNEYTAYWLHLAVLRNSRSDGRSTTNDTYLTQPTFARWLVDTQTPPYAIANLSVVPVEIRERTRVLQRFGNAAVVARLSSTTAAAGDTCGVSPLITGS